MALTRAGRARKDAAGALFWLVLLSSVVVILSGVLPMTPLFGTVGQHIEHLTHRYPAIVLALALALNAAANASQPCLKE